MSESEADRLRARVAELEAALRPGSGFVGDPHPVKDPVFRGAQLVVAPGESMRERVARAVSEPEIWDEAVCRLIGMTLWPEAREYAFRTADAVLAALREPTGAMIDAGADTYGVHDTAIGSLPLTTIDGQPSKAWRAMIDAAGEP